MELNRSFVKQFCVSYDYPDGAIAALDDALTAIENSPVKDAFIAQLSRYPAEKTTEQITDILEQVKKLVPQIGKPTETVELLLFILLAEPLKAEYDKAGLPEKVYRDSMLDLRAKLIECYDMRGIWGSFVADWFPRFFALDRFGFTRLQFEMTTLPEINSPDGRVHLPAGLKAVNIHIPSFGPLIKEDVEQSFREAAAFFAPHFPGEPIRFHCHSWLLYPPHYDFLPQNSRILQFMDFFELVEWNDDDTYWDLWRIFGNCDHKDVANLPRDTGIRRAYAKRLEDGLPVGYGRGIFYYPHP